MPLKKTKKPKPVKKPKVQKAKGWVKPVPTNFQVICCDCGRVTKLTFKWWHGAFWVKTSKLAKVNVL